MKERLIKLLTDRQTVLTNKSNELQLEMQEIINLLTVINALDNETFIFFETSIDNANHIPLKETCEKLKKIDKAVKKLKYPREVQL